ncbi:hypothetical protein RRG08_062072 [Elysia crispata]|uniref:Secreted protein n=1 Tax=Elysia crispata TaxID=231223 RepID=A0AAE0ZIV7_9GAST|nr:hypothetical protein RRG08_062072 [Elysia crispata]
MWRFNIRSFCPLTVLGRIPGVLGQLQWRLLQDLLHLTCAISAHNINLFQHASQSPVAVGCRREGAPFVFNSGPIVQTSR